MQFNGDDLKRAVGTLRLIRFSPLADADTASALMEELARMCPTLEGLEWVTRRTLQLYTEWPGLRELRAVLCARFQPADGIEVFSEVYSGGIPPQLPTAQDLPALPPGHVMTADPELDATVMNLASRKALPPIPAITAAHVQRAVVEREAGPCEDAKQPRRDKQ
jgi:hypothetical protein